MTVRVLAAAFVVAFAACGSDSNPTPPGGNSNKTIDVFTIGDSFVSTFVDATPGDTIRWNFTGGSDGLGHNVRFAIVTGRPADINVLKTGTASRVFTLAGTFNYFCDVHPGMNGTVIVK